MDELFAFVPDGVLFALVLGHCQRSHPPGESKSILFRHKKQPRIYDRNIPTQVVANNNNTTMTTLEEKYQCLDSAGYTCADNCEDLQGCADCGCVVLAQSTGGDWGDFMDVFFCLLPILFLVYATIKPNPLPTTTSLPAAAVFMYLVRLMYLQSDPLLTTGAVILGLHEAITPLSIMAGAITLFESMEATYCLPYMMREIKALTAGHPIAEAML